MILWQKSAVLNNSSYYNRNNKKENISFQALNAAQKPVFKNLETYLGPKGIAEADKSLTRLKAALDGDVKGKTVLVAYGGGKDSSYMTAFVRYMQLKILQPEKTMDTFKMRIVTNRQSHMPFTVMSNIDNTFKALGIYKDKNVEAFVVDGDKTTKASKNMPISRMLIPQKIIERDRRDMLMAGHLTQAEPRRVFCDACNAYMQKGEAHAITKGNGVDLIMTGDSLKELAHYKKWIDRLYGFVTGQPQKPAVTKTQNFMDYMGKIETIGGNYFAKVHGNDGKDRFKMPQSTVEQKTPKLFSIYSETPYDAGSHRKMLDEFLGFKFDTESLTFSFTESDCSMPALMGHLRGLKAEKVHGRTYQDGIKDYAEKIAIPIMEEKHFPADLVTKQKELYSSPEKMSNMRARVAQHYKTAMNLSDENLTCMVYSPFVSQCMNLQGYLEKEKPELLPHYNKINAVIAGKKPDNVSKNCIKKLEEASGLSLKEMKHIYKQEANNHNVISELHSGDPHKKEVVVKHSSKGLPVWSVISGR
jgi:hypothetical protein